MLGPTPCFAMFGDILGEILQGPYTPCFSMFGDILGEILQGLYAMKILKKDFVLAQNEVEHTRTENRVLQTIRYSHKVHIEYQSVCPLVGIGPSPPPLLQVCPPPPGTKGGYHTRMRVRGWGSPNSDD